VQNNPNIPIFAMITVLKVLMNFTNLILIVSLLSLLFALPKNSASNISGENGQLRTVVIDPGHGGHDPGAVSGDIREKDLVLSVGLRLGNKIKNSFPGVKVIYTRSKDVFIPLHERATIAIKNKADVFISIHANYVAETRVRGTETFTLGLHRSQENLEVAKKENAVILLEDDYSANYQGFDPRETESYIMFENLQSEYQSQSIELASQIQNAFTKNIGLVNRGVKQAGFLVLRQTSMPSVLVEIGFISNPSERGFLYSETGREKISESIFQAFSNYKKSIDQRSRFELASAGENETSPAIPDKQVLGDSTRSVADIPSDGTSEQTPETNSKETQTGSPQPVKNITDGIFYSVQIGAGKTITEPTPQNFKGEKNIFRVRVEPYFKFYSGRFQTAEEAFTEKSRLNSKFPDAFVVIFENGIPKMFMRR
jgi:N-acetylmuramoyl-L-alanine amidase